MPNWSKAKRAQMASANISSLNWHLLVDLKNVSGKEERKKLLAPFTKLTVLPGLMAWLNSNVVLKKNDEGLYSVKLIMKDLISKIETGSLYFSDGCTLGSKQLKGMLCFLANASRGEIVLSTVYGKQTAKNALRWAANVPLFMSAFKQYRDVNYMEWDWDDDWAEYVLDKHCLELCRRNGSTFKYTAEELIDLRELGRTGNEGASEGVKKPLDAATTMSFNANDFTVNPLVKDFAALPRLVKTALCQTWIFMPQFWHDLGVYNFPDIDTKPTPLSSEDIIAAKEPTDEAFWRA